MLPELDPGPDPTWADDVFHRPPRRLTAAVFALLLHEQLWIHRRVERLTFRDSGSIRRSVSLDFTVPAEQRGALALGEEDAGLLVPLTLLRKGVLRNFDLRDETGAAIPTLTKEQNGAVSTAMLRSAGEAALRRPLSDEVAEDLLAIATGAPEDASRVLERFRRPGPGLVRDERIQVFSEPRIRALLQDLVSHFVCFAVIPAGARRRVIKFAFDQRFARLSPRWRHRLATSPFPIAILAPAAGRAASFHTLVVVPSDLRIESARLLDRATTPPRVLSQDRHTDAAALYSSGHDRGARAAVHLTLRVPATGFLTAALALASAALFLFVAGAVFSDAIAEQTEATAAIMAAVPAIFVGLVLRPGEHPLVQTLFSGLRALLAAVGALSLIGATSLTVGVDGTLLSLLWVALSVASLAITAVIAVAYVRGRQVEQLEVRPSGPIW